MINDVIFSHCFSWRWIPSSCFDGCLMIIVSHVPTSHLVWKNPNPPPPLALPWSPASPTSPLLQPKDPSGDAGADGAGTVDVSLGVAVLRRTEPPCRYRTKSVHTVARTRLDRSTSGCMSAGLARVRNKTTQSSWAKNSYPASHRHWSQRRSWLFKFPTLQSDTYLLLTSFKQICENSSWALGNGHWTSCTIRMLNGSMCTIYAGSDSSDCQGTGITCARFFAFGTRLCCLLPGCLGAMARPAQKTAPFRPGQNWELQISITILQLQSGKYDCMHGANDTGMHGLKVSGLATLVGQVTGHRSVKIAQHETT